MLRCGGVHWGVVDLTWSGHYFGHITYMSSHSLGAGIEVGRKSREGSSEAWPEWNVNIESEKAEDMVFPFAGTLLEWTNRPINI